MTREDWGGDRKASRHRSGDKWVSAKEEARRAVNKHRRAHQEELQAHRRYQEAAKENPLSDDVCALEKLTTAASRAVRGFSNLQGLSFTVSFEEMARTRAGLLKLLQDAEVPLQEVHCQVNLSEVNGIAEKFRRTAMEPLLSSKDWPKIDVLTLQEALQADSYFNPKGCGTRSSRWLVKCEARVTLTHEQKEKLKHHVAELAKNGGVSFP